MAVIDQINRRERRDTLRCPSVCDTGLGDAAGEVESTVHDLLGGSYWRARIGSDELSYCGQKQSFANVWYQARAHIKL